jgi:hypothetical protein
MLLLIRKPSDPRRGRDDARKGATFLRLGKRARSEPAATRFRASTARLRLRAAPPLRRARRTGCVRARRCTAGPQRRPPRLALPTRAGPRAANGRRAARGALGAARLRRGAWDPALGSAVACAVERQWPCMLSPPRARPRRLAQPPAPRRQCVDPLAPAAWHRRVPPAAWRARHLTLASRLSSPTQPLRPPGGHAVLAHAEPPLPRGPGATARHGGPARSAA